MKSFPPFLSLQGIGLTILLLAGLALVLWMNGGMVFSPGPVSAQTRPDITPGSFSSHADFEKECRRCHQPLRASQVELCLACHQDVSQEIDSRSGIHGQIDGVQQCAGCHPDHQGRDFDLNQEALARFDHSLSRFSLVWHQVNYDAALISCWSCHVNGDGGLAFSQEACSECHSSEDPRFMSQHIQDFETNCLACHDGKDTLARFDHSLTAFPLVEKHSQAGCAECHTRERRSSQLRRPFAGTPVDCIACHTEPALHGGVLGTDCRSCHNESSWRPALLDGTPFEHQQATQFSLALHTVSFDQEPISCSGCHPSGIQHFEQQACASCHQDHDAPFILQHTEQLGFACIECHDGVDRMQGFDHAQLFPLEGRHAELGCQDCHTGQKYRGTPDTCAGCHAEPELHAGFFGQRCGDCHTTLAWAPAHLRVHSFRLDHGGRGQVSCQTCHPNRYPEYTCYGCHDHQPEPLAEEHARIDVNSTVFPDCAACHPTGNE